MKYIYIYLGLLLLRCCSPPSFTLLLLVSFFYVAARLLLLRCSSPYASHKLVAIFMHTFYLTVQTQQLWKQNRRVIKQSGDSLLEGIPRPSLAALLP